MTPEEAAAERAAKAEAARRITEGLRYIVAKYGHFAGLTQQVAAQMTKLTSAWSAAGGNGSPDPAASTGGGGSGGGSGGAYGTRSGPVSAGGVFQPGGPGTQGGGAGSSWSPNVSYGSGGVQPPSPGVAWGSAGGGGGGSGGSYAPGGGGYASGGLVVSPGVRRGGTPGFDGDARLVAGSVTGYRWWTILAPDLNASPADAGQDWPEAPLHGAWAPWAPGVNHAVCLANPDGPPPHDPALVPERPCGCGYWGYWGIQRHELGRTGALPVFGVIKGFGKTLTGPYGFRCARARILAVHLPLTIGNVEHMAAGREQLLSPRHPAPRFTGKVISIGTDYVPSSLGGPLPARNLPEPPTEAEIAADKLKAEAWMAVIGDRIEQMYPGVEVCETRRHLLAKYPPDPVYGDRRLDVPGWLQPWMLPWSFIWFWLLANMTTLLTFAAVFPVIRDEELDVPGPAQYRKAQLTPPGSKHYGAARVASHMS